MRSTGRRNENLGLAACMHILQSRAAAMLECKRPSAAVRRTRVSTPQQGGGGTGPPGGLGSRTLTGRPGASRSGRSAG